MVIRQPFIRKKQVDNIPSANMIFILVNYTFILMC